MSPLDVVAFGAAGGLAVLCVLVPVAFVIAVLMQTQARLKREHAVAVLEAQRQ